MQHQINAFIAATCAGKSNETPRAYRTKLNYLARWLDGRPLNQENLDAWRAWLLGRVGKRELSPWTVRTVITTVRHFLRWSGTGVEIQNIKEPPVMPKAVEQPVIDALIEAAGKVGGAWQQARNRAILYLLRDTGGRAGSIAGIELGCIDLARGMINAPCKGGAETWLFISEPSAAAIRAWLRYRPELCPRDERLFVGRYGRGITRQTIHQVLNRLARAAGVLDERHNAHSFRHAFARDMVFSGVDLSIVSPLMGHHGTAITAKYYARFNVKELKRAHKKASPGRWLVSP